MLSSDIKVRGPVGEEKEDEAWQEPFLCENEMPAAILLCSSVSSQQMSLPPLPLPASTEVLKKGWRWEQQRMALSEGDEAGGLSLS